MYFESLWIVLGKAQFSCHVRGGTDGVGLQGQREGRNKADIDGTYFEIYSLLYRLGVTTNYTGFFYMAYAVILCTKQPECLLLVTKWLYPEVAKQYGTNWRAMERSIRTVNSIIWRENRPLLEELACRSLKQRPRSAQLLSMLAASLAGTPFLDLRPKT